MPYSFVADSFHIKKLRSRLSSSMQRSKDNKLSTVTAFYG